MIKPITRAEYNKLHQLAKDCMNLASNHDPDHAKELRELRSRLEVCERQLERLGAPKYRIFRNGRAPIPLKREK